LVSKRKHLIILALIFVFLFLAGCTPSTPSPDATKPGGILRIGSWQEPGYLNPLLADMMAEAEVCRMVFSGLLRVNSAMEYLPDLARDIPTLENGGLKVAGDQVTITYNLREDVKWHDGTDFTARDVLFTYNTYMNDQVNVSSRDGYDRITECKIIDPHTIQITMEGIYPAYKQLFSYIIPEHLLAQSVDMNSDGFNQNPVGTGPFIFTQWVSGSHIELKANPDYYGEGPFLDGVVYKIVPDTNTLLTQLKTGEVDVFMSFGWTQFSEIENTAGVNPYVTPALDWEHLDFNLRLPLFQDKRVRQAIMYALDRQEIVDLVMQGKVKVATSGQAPLSWAYNPNVKQYTRDPEKAALLLQEAGWETGADGFYQKNGQKLSFVCSTTAGNRQREMVQQIMQEQLRTVGIEMIIRNYDPPTLFGDLISNLKFETVLFAWSADVDPDDYSLWSSAQLPPNGQNFPGFVDARVDDLLVRTRSTFDQGERKQYFDEIQAILAEELPVIPMYFHANLDAVRTELRGYQQNPTLASDMWNCNEWWLQE
jgi:peptide/nickel transport system substrate-binding protein